MPELTATLKAMYSVESRKNKFMAALQGVEMNSDDSDTLADNEKPSTFQEIQARAAAKLNASVRDVEAIRHGITPDMGIAYDIIVSSDSK